MADLIANLSNEQRETLVRFLVQLRNDLSDGVFLRETFYTDDRSKLAGNTHQYWLRLGLASDLHSIVEDLLPVQFPDHVAHWLILELKRKLFDRLPGEYSTLIKIPFSVPIGKVGAARAKRIERTIERRLPTITPYAVFFHQINRLLSFFGDVEKHSNVAEAKCLPRLRPNEREVDLLLTRYSKCSIAKARRCFPGVWDELRGHYVLDSRGAQFAKRLAKELEARNLLSATSKFVDIGSGVGTNVFAVNRYSAAHATGVELHREIFKLSEIANRRLERIGILDPKRLEFQLGNAFDSQVIDIAKFDVIYVYSSLGKFEIDIDQVVNLAKPNAVIVFNQMPTRNVENVVPLESVADLFAFRKKS